MRPIYSLILILLISPAAKCGYGRFDQSDSETGHFRFEFR